ncbi:MAG: hypothetical protein J7647_26230 [Cyanobacteria bacterium SBLK]|nr:hypothetical protein [Cyanobacteria bacterium SBLK]
MVQTNYSIFQEKGFEGGLATCQNPTSLQGTYSELVNGSITDYLSFGRVIVLNAIDPSKVKLPSAAGQNPQGVTVAVNAYEKDVNGQAGYPPERPVTRLIKGAIFVVPEVAVTGGDPVYFRHTLNAVPGAYEARGRVRNNADGDKADLWTKATFLESAAAGELVALQID